MTDPHQTLPEPLDFAYQVFSTDRRVADYARKRFEVPKDDEDNVFLKKAVLRLWHIAKDASRLACRQKGRVSCPEQAWYDEARILADRVGKRWETTPVPTLVEALKDDEMLYPLAFPRVSIAGGAQTSIITQPYVVFRGRRLVLGSESDCAQLVIHDMKVGKNSQFCNSCALFGGCFSNVAFPFRLKLDTAQVSQCITLVVENMGEKAVSLSATLFGVTLDTRPPIYATLQAAMTRGRLR